MSRAARIYSVAFPALILTFSLDSIGRLISPHVYNASWGYSSENQIWQFIANVLFVNRLWFNDVTPGSNLPFWSLGFEVWYYVIFGMCMFLTGWWRVIAVVSGLVIAGPQIVAMLPIWLVGVGCYHLSARLANWPRSREPRCVSAASPVGSVMRSGAVRHGRLIGLVPPMLGRPELMQDYLVTVLFAGHLLGFNAVSRTFTVPDRVAKSVRWVAGATFSLYLFHLPITQILTALSPWPLASAPNRVLLVGGTLVIAFALAELTERKKELWRVGMSRAFSRLTGPSAS